MTLPKEKKTSEMFFPKLGAVKKKSKNSLSSYVAGTVNC
jgi:hypothetical protein